MEKGWQAYDPKMENDTKSLIQKLRDRATERKRISSHDTVALTLDELASLLEKEYEKQAG